MEFRQYGFVCTENDFDKALKKFEWAYKLKNNETAFLSLILLDNEEARSYLSSKLSEIIPNLCSYDIGYESNDMTGLDKTIKSGPTYLYNLEKYAKRRSKEKNISYDKALDECYFGINFARDGLFLERKSTFIMVLDDQAYFRFKVEGDDFCDYCYPRLDLNHCFKNKNGLSLSEFHKQEESKIFTKK